MSHSQSIPRFDSATKVKEDDDVEKQTNGPETTAPAGDLSGAAAAAGLGLPEGRHRSYTGSTFTQSKLLQFSLVLK